MKLLIVFLLVAIASSAFAADPSDSPASSTTVASNGETVASLTATVDGATTTTISTESEITDSTNAPSNGETTEGITAAPSLGATESTNAPSGSEITDGITNLPSTATSERTTGPPSGETTVSASSGVSESTTPPSGGETTQTTETSSVSASSGTTDSTTETPGDETTRSSASSETTETSTISSSGGTTESVTASSGSETTDSSTTSASTNTAAASSSSDSTTTETSDSSTPAQPSTDSPSTEKPTTKPLQCYTCEGDNCNEKSVINCPDDGQTYYVEDVLKAMRASASDLLFGNYRSTARLEQDKVKAYACYSAQVAGNDEKKLQLGCIAIREGLSACDSVRQDLDIGTNDTDFTCLACQTDLCNGSELAKLSAVALFCVALARLFI